MFFPKRKWRHAFCFKLLNFISVTKIYKMSEIKIRFMQEVANCFVYDRVQLLPSSRFPGRWRHRWFVFWREPSSVSGTTEILMKFLFTSWFNLISCYSPRAFVSMSSARNRAPKALQPLSHSQKIPGKKFLRVALIPSQYSHYRFSFRTWKRFPQDDLHSLSELCRSRSDRAWFLGSAHRRQSLIGK